MATKSILKEIKITNEQDALRLLEAMETSAKTIIDEITANSHKKCEEINSDEIEDFFKTRKGNK